MPLRELSSEFFFLGKRGERDSAPILAGNVLGDEGLSSGGGRRGLLGQSVPVDSDRTSFVACPFSSAGFSFSMTLREGVGV